jgi:spore coat polysaccharide biosynthesis protein SpsF (cytidylyltransferase family)
VKILAIIQCRLNSTRLPKKALADLYGSPLINHVILRAQQVRRVDKVVLNIPHKDVELFGRPCEIYPVENQEQDVLASFVRIAKFEQADAVMRVTGDCPLFAPDAADLVVDRFLCADADYVSNVGTVAGEQVYTKWSDGFDCELFGTEILLRAERETRDNPYHRQHVTSWMRVQKHYPLCQYVHAPRDFSALKCSVDTKDDLERVRAILMQQPADTGYAATYQAWEWAGRP